MNHGGNSKCMRLLLFLSAAGLLLSFCSGANAEMREYVFDNISNNNAADAAIGEAQLTARVEDTMNANQVLFTFLNSGSDLCSITEVYFDGATLLGIAAIKNGTGVSFAQDATPANLPGANNAVPPFVTSAGLSADSDPPVQPNGVNPGESLGILFDLQSGNTFANVVSDLADAGLRVGIHVQGFASGGSESFVNNSVPLPVPGAVLLGFLGLTTAATRLRRHI